MPKGISFDDGIIAAMQGGDESALGIVIDRYTAYVGTIVWNIVGGKMNEADAKEIISETFYTLWKNRSKIQQGKLKPYLSSIARSRSLNSLKHANWDVALDYDLIQSIISGPEDDAIKKEEYAALRKALDSLPEPDRIIFIRHYYSYQTTSEIAEKMKLNIKTVQSKLLRGREALRKELTKGGYFIG